MSIQRAYADTDDLVDDAAQQAVVDRLADLQAQLNAAGDKRTGLLDRLLRSREPVRGIYLWGGVGRGKTFLMDLFFNTLPTTQKKRIHFHRLMREVHAGLNALQDAENPVDVVAEELASELRVLCFDELFVNDIGDAMILARLLSGLFERGVTLVATSNAHPDDLYKEGLQRERFLPAIDLIKSHLEIVELDNATDYRLRTMRQAGTFFVEASADKLADIVRRIAPGPTTTETPLVVNGRELVTVMAAKGVVWFDFATLCEGPRSVEDYIEIARCYHTVILSETPVMDRQREDAARRFIALVDEFYDRKVKLVLSAATPVAELYRGTRLAFEFERTESRLIEMQSTDYLQSAHLP